MTGPLLSLRGITKAYGNPGETAPVFEDLDFDLHRAEFACLLGPSGSGKSTILSLIAGLMNPDRGRVSFDGQDLAELTDNQRARLRSTRIGVVLQSGNLVPFLTAAENVAMAARLSGIDVSAARVRGLLEGVGMADRSGHLPRRLSGGEAQRVGLAIALVHEPDLLLADEALGPLDSQTARLVMETLDAARRKRGLAMLLVTHNREVAALGSRTVELIDGRLEDIS